MIFLSCIYLDLLQGLFEGSLLRSTCGETFALLMCNGCQRAGAWGRSGAVMAFAHTHALRVSLALPFWDSLALTAIAQGR